MQWFKFDIRDMNLSLYEKYFSLMSDERKEYTKGIKTEKNRLLTVAGEMLVRKNLSKICGIDEAEITVKKDENGKPYCNIEDFNFSISHSGDFAACVISQNPVGIDIEKERDINLKVALKFCNESELEYINGSIPRFFEIWTAKEAAYKMFGGAQKEFKKIDTAKLNKQYFNFSGYTVCIVTK